MVQRGRFPRGKARLIKRPFRDPGINNGREEKQNGAEQKHIQDRIVFETFWGNTPKDVKEKASDQEGQKITKPCGQRQRVNDLKGLALNRCHAFLHGREKAEGDRVPAGEKEEDGEHRPIRADSEMDVGENEIPEANKGGQSDQKEFAPLLKLNAEALQISDPLA